MPTAMFFANDELPISPILRSTFSGSCMSGPASLVVILSSYLIALGRTARCCALHRELDPGSMRRGRNRHHSDTTGNERFYGRIAQGRGRNEVIDVGRPPMWCMPDQPISGRGRRKVGDRHGKQSWIHNTLPKGCRCATGHKVTRGTYIPFPQEYSAIFGYRARAAERRLTKGARVPEAPPQVPQPQRRGHPNPTKKRRSS